MDSKVCVTCNTEKNFDNFFNRYRECKQRNIERSLKRYYENKDKSSNQRKIYYEKEIAMCYLQSLKEVSKTEYLIHNKYTILTIK